MATSKGVVAEAATGRQAASFVLGCVVALTLVLLLQRRPDPEELISRTARDPVGFFGWISLPPQSPSSSSARNGTSSPPSAEVAPPVNMNTTASAATKGDESLQQQAAHHQAATKDDATKGRGPDAADGGGSPPRRLPPSISPAAHRQQGDDDNDKQEAAESEFRGLAAAVSRAATPDDRTVIITCVNQAWAAPGSLLELFLESFRVGDGIAHLLDHVLIVAMDAAAMARCEALRHPHCYLYTPVPGLDFSSAKFFLSKEYLELVWSKLKLQRRVLQLGYNFVFTDVDILWFRNPFKHVTAYADMTVSSDVFFGDPDNVDNFPNTGFFHVRPNNRTIAMTRLWHQARERYPGRNEQPVFNAIKRRLVADLGLRLQYIDPAFMGGFCSYGKDLAKICTMHANCCVGLGNKLRDLRTLLDDWKNYTSTPHWARKDAKWTVPGACIH